MPDVSTRSRSVEDAEAVRAPIRDEMGRQLLLELYRRMLLIRRFEEKAVGAYRQKKIAGFFHPYIGTEPVATGFMCHLGDEDYTTTSYRCHAQGLLLGLPPRSLMAELFGKVTGNVRGKGGSMHFFSKERKFLGGHGIVGGQLPVGAGAAFACKYRKTGGISLTFMGDGATVQGTLHESLNLCSLWDLPALYVIENNEWGMGTAVHRAVSVDRIAEAKAPGYDIVGHTVDGTDLYATWQLGRDIISGMRDDNRPVLVEAKGVRFMGHSVSDAQAYRTREAIKQMRESRDGLVRVAGDLVEADWASAEELEEIDAEIKATVADAIAYADASPEPPMSELQRHVFAQ
ncbi:MAG: pyruvate dehydrogenase (acetyl-transferring) E1 component subunit alpha [Planctomycetota bacterium]